MNEILISIHTEFAKKIYTGEKRFELRKRAPNMTPGTRCWIYEPKPVGKVTGYFYYDGYLDGDKDMLWQQLHEHLGISKEQYYAYYKNQQHVYAWQISNQHRAKPRPLSDFGTRHAPQSYQRLLPSQKEKRQITDAAKTAGDGKGQYLPVMANATCNLTTTGIPIP